MTGSCSGILLSLLPSLGITSVHSCTWLFFFFFKNKGVGNPDSSHHTCVVSTYLLSIFWPQTHVLVEVHRSHGKPTAEIRPEQRLQGNILLQMLESWLSSYFFCLVCWMEPGSKLPSPRAFSSTQLQWFFCSSVVVDCSTKQEKQHWGLAY